MPYGFNDDKSKYQLKVDSKVTSTLSASNWSNKQYSFESTYPNATYDIEIEPNGDSVTEAQLNAWGAAKLAGSATTNVLKALGTTPTVDIPIIIKVVTK